MVWKTAVIKCAVKRVYELFRKLGVTTGSSKKVIFGIWIIYQLSRLLVSGFPYTFSTIKSLWQGMFMGIRYREQYKNNST